MASRNVLRRGRFRMWGWPQVSILEEKCSPQVVNFLKTGFVLCNINTVRYERPERRMAVFWICPLLPVFHRLGYGDNTTLLLHAKIAFNDLFDKRNEWRRESEYEDKILIAKIQIKKTIYVSIGLSKESKKNCITVDSRSHGPEHLCQTLGPCSHNRQLKSKDFYVLFPRSTSF